MLPLDRKKGASVALLANWAGRCVPMSTHALTQLIIVPPPADPDEPDKLGDWLLGKVARGVCDLGLTHCELAVARNLPRHGAWNFSRSGVVPGTSLGLCPELLRGCAQKGPLHDPTGTAPVMELDSMSKEGFTQ